METKNYYLEYEKYASPPRWLVFARGTSNWIGSVTEDPPGFRGWKNGIETSALFGSVELAADWIYREVFAGQSPDRKVEKKPVPRPHPSNEPRGNLAALFTYHPPRGKQPNRYEEIRNAGRELASAILIYCPPCADTTAAIRKVREAVMTANAAIALEPES